MSKRLEMLQTMTQKSNDPFAWYALAMEYAKLERWDEALATFSTLRQRHPDYLPMYLMAGQLLIDRAKQAEARDWLEAGIALARQSNDSKALSELEAALATA